MRDAAFRQASEERPGAVHLELPEDIAADDAGTLQPLEPLMKRRPVAEAKGEETAAPSRLAGVRSNRSSDRPGPETGPTSNVALGGGRRSGHEGGGDDPRGQAAAAPDRRWCKPQDDAKNATRVCGQRRHPFL